jgi:hypothetical protein
LLAQQGLQVAVGLCGRQTGFQIHRILRFVGVFGGCELAWIEVQLVEMYGVSVWRRGEDHI